MSSVPSRFNISPLSQLKFAKSIDPGIFKDKTPQIHLRMLEFINRPSKRSVFDSPIAQDVAALLTALLHPFDEAKLKRALLSLYLDLILTVC